MVNWEDKPAYGLGALALGVLLVWQSSRRTEPTPPGPRKFPVVGNMLSMPSKRQWEVFRDWKAVYGDLVYLEGFGQCILAVNSLPLAQKLLVNRAANYSDRGWTPLGDIIGFGWAFHMMNYGTLWRDHRRAFHQHLNQTQTHLYHPIIVQENARFMQRLLLKNVGFKEDMKLFFGALIMRVSYGRDDLEYNRQLIKEGQKFGEDWMEYSLPGRLLVGTFPSLQHLPSWFPGTGWKSIVEELTKSCAKTRSKAYVELKARLKEGIQGDYNVAEQLISALPNEDDPAYQYEDDVAKNVAAISFLAGADTTISSAMALILGLAMHPEVQQRAQKELDDVVGNERVPSFEDIDRLPYIQAIILEVTRWHTVLPYGAPHVSTDDDVLDGYKIPGGTMILTNNWAIMHDPEVFDDPMTFKPERYLKGGQINKEVLDPNDVAFGYGRRICPGRHLSNASLTLMAASLLAFFDIKPSIGADGKPVPLKYDVKSEASLFAFPKDFDCDIVPRSVRHAEAIRNLNL